MSTEPPRPAVDLPAAKPWKRITLLAALLATIAACCGGIAVAVRGAVGG